MSKSQLSLIEMTQITKEVPLPGTSKNLTVYGYCADAIAYLIMRFASFKQVLDVATAEGVPALALADMGAETLSYLAAAPLLNREDFENTGEWRKQLIMDAPLASKLPITTQIDIVKAALEVSFPEGITPFVEGVQKSLEDLGILEVFKRLQGSETTPQPQTNANANLTMEPSNQQA